MRMRMKRIQRIMDAIRIHRQLTKKQKEINSVGSKTPNKWAEKSIMNRTQMLRGRISSGRKRTRDLWYTRNKSSTTS